MDREHLNTRNLRRRRLTAARQAARDAAIFTRGPLPANEKLAESYATAARYYGREAARLGHLARPDLRLNIRAPSVE
jgi:hypothetical protein